VEELENVSREREREREGKVSEERKHGRTEPQSMNYWRLTGVAKHLRP
jgi:hypothetical protein